MQSNSEPSAPPPESPEDDPYQPEFYQSLHPTAFTPPANQPFRDNYGFNPSLDRVPHDAQGNYGIPTTFGYAHWMGSQTQLPNQQIAHHDVATVSTYPPVIIAQPAPIVQSPPSYLGWSIFNFLCCFWPLGLAAIVYSAKVGSARSYENAKRHSLTARNLNVAATAIAPILAALIAGMVMGFGANVGVSRSSEYYYTTPPGYYEYYQATTTAKANAYYYVYGYAYYYTYLMYYTDYTFAYNLVYASSRNTLYGTYYSYPITEGKYVSTTGFRYVVDSYYRYT